MPVRAARGARHAVLPARPARAHARRLAAFAVAGALALLTHYFALFLLAPMCVWLLVAWSPPAPARRAGSRRRRGPRGPRADPPRRGPGRPRHAVDRALGARQPPGSDPPVLLTGYSGAPLGHGIELLVALLILAGLGYGLWSVLEPREERGALIALLLSACGVLIPVALVAFGADYLAPRNLVAAMIPLTALIALVTVAARTGRVGAVIASLIALAFLALSIDVDLSPRLQRGDWRGIAQCHGLPARRRRAVLSRRLSWRRSSGVLPPAPAQPPRRATVTVTKSTRPVTAAASRRRPAARPRLPPVAAPRRPRSHPLPLHLTRPALVTEAALRAHVITEAHPEVLVP